MKAFLVLFSGLPSTFAPSSPALNLSMFATQTSTLKSESAASPPCLMPFNPLPPCYSAGAERRSETESGSSGASQTPVGDYATYNGRQWRRQELDMEEALPPAYGQESITRAERCFWWGFLCPVIWLVGLTYAWKTTQPSQTQLKIDSHSSRRGWSAAQIMQPPQLAEEDVRQMREMWRGQELFWARLCIKAFVVTLLLSGILTALALVAMKAWSTASRFLKPTSLYDDTAQPASPDHTVMAALVELRNARVTDKLLSSFFHQVQQQFGLVTDDLEHFYAAWRQDPSIDNALGWLECLVRWFEHWKAPLLAVGAGETEVAAYRQVFLTSFDYTLSPEFAPMLQMLLAHLFHAQDQAILTQLHNLDLLGRYRAVLFQFTFGLIEDKVAEECAQEWSSSQLQRLQFWLHEIVKPWLHSLLQDPLEATQAKFDFHLYKTLSDLRIRELFDIIVEHPDSMPALEDLKTCLTRTDDRLLLATSLRDANVKRLLHPGADTKDIIEQYVSTIRCLRFLDPPGVLLSRVAEPVRAYLRAREDTIRCIMSALIEDGGDLVEELEQSAGQDVEDGAEAGQGEDFSDRNWMPDPLDAPPDFHLNKKSDIIQMLVSIYDSKDVFIKEFQVLLAQSLLGIKDYDADRQIRNVEILKKRFGETSLQVCEVMLKDLADSKRIDQNVHAFARANPIHPTVISKLFWPTLQTSELRLPQQMTLLQQSYQQHFAALKPDKRLHWVPSLGTVDIEIELDDRTISMEVSPVQAAVAELFQDQASWTLPNLAAKLTSDEDTSLIRNALYFWSSAGLLQESTDGKWNRLDQSPTSAAAALPPKQAPFDEQPGIFTSSRQQELEEMRAYWQFIRTLLSNLKTSFITTSKMHTMLTKSVPTYIGRTQEQLMLLLEQLQAEGQIKTGAQGGWVLC